MISLAGILESLRGASPESRADMHSTRAKAHVHWLQNDPRYCSVRLPEKGGNTGEVSAPATVSRARPPRSTLLFRLEAVAHECFAVIALLSAFAVASALHFFIFSCCVIGMASSPFNHAR